MISLVLITHGYIILIWDGVYAGMDENNSLAFQGIPLVGFGRIIQHIPTSLSMMTQSGMDFYRALKANPYATTIFA